MAVTVKYFASLRERMGRSEERIAYSPALTVLGVWRAVSPGAPFEENVLTAVNYEHVPSTHPVADGDEVAFFPPVTGG
jgi:sulfur-carrier protein